MKDKPNSSHGHTYTQKNKNPYRMEIKVTLSIEIWTYPLIKDISYAKSKSFTSSIKGLPVTFRIVGAQFKEFKWSSRSQHAWELYTSVQTFGGFEHYSIINLVVGKSSYDSHGLCQGVKFINGTPTTTSIVVLGGILITRKHSKMGVYIYMYGDI